MTIQFNQGGGEAGSPGNSAAASLDSATTVAGRGQALPVPARSDPCGSPGAVRFVPERRQVERNALETAAAQRTPRTHGS